MSRRWTVEPEDLAALIQMEWNGHITRHTARKLLDELIKTGDRLVNVWKNWEL